MGSIFTAKSYKSFLISLIETQPSGGRGVRKFLALAVGCQVAYVTQVLGGSAHFSAEQAEAAARFFQLSPSETQALLLLLGENRAGTVGLRKFYREQLEALREQSGLLKNRLAIAADLPEQVQAIYYGSWIFGAVHMAIHVPALRTGRAIARHLGLPLTSVNSTLLFLKRHGLAAEEKNEFRPKGDAHHLRKHSPYLARHLSNWRLKAIEAAEENPNDTLQYSGVVACSRTDFEKIRELLSECLKESIRIVRNSPAEEVAVLSFDLFPLAHRF